MRIGTAIRGAAASVAVVISLASTSAGQPAECRAPAGVIDEVLRPGQRIAWTQDVPDGTPIDRLGFRLWLNDGAAELASVSCTEGTERATLECDGALPDLTPGVHHLCVGATVEGSEGPVAWSSALSVRVDAPR